MNLEEVMPPFAHCFDNCARSFLNSWMTFLLANNVREKDATGLPSRLSVAEIAISDASVSSTKGILGSIVTKIASINSFFKLSNAFIADSGTGKAVLRALSVHHNPEGQKRSLENVDVLGPVKIRQEKPFLVAVVHYKLSRNTTTSSSSTQSDNGNEEDESYGKSSGFGTDRCKLTWIESDSSDLKTSPTLIKREDNQISAYTSTGCILIGTAPLRAYKQRHEDVPPTHQD
ncbi:hypothetical protein T265_07770 [Opisthorchis viverrini]|uniref:Uncharacterized protein n=1 Tax=Opisthorchis viverrini TaxID=6198 RepID=A0A075AAP4_OPIVI|nr:hypothetical protein T265_07770 [Opisthorchis viverrini]KER24629.1 hypothetical protein T265_07770 [Opisthorchis viverrini]